MRRNVSPSVLMVAAGTVLVASSLASAQQLINVSGSSLLGSFIRGQQSTNDYIGVSAQTPALGTDLVVASSIWSVNYRVSGSINGFDELINFGYPAFIQIADNRTSGNTDALNSLLLTDQWYNRTQYITAGVTSTPPAAPYTAGNPGGQPQRAASNGANRAIVGTNSTGGVTIDVAYTDVPAIWGIVNGTAAQGNPSAKPNTPGYGTNPRPSVARDGSATGTVSGGGLTNALSTLGSRNLADFPGRNLLTDPYDTNTIFEYPLTLAPVAPVANPGTGITRMTLSQERFLWATGRATTGENFVVSTRDIGSGTRNAFNNYIGLDPSYGVGDNIGVQSTLSIQDQLGPDFWPTNKGATSGLLRTVRYHRLAVGYAGAETAVSGGSPSSWLTNQVIDIIDTFNDVYYTSNELATLFPSGPAATDFKRPTLANILDNTRNGWVINGQARISTIGDPRAEAATFRTASLPNDGGTASGNPAMVNKSAARYVNNILRSIADFDGTVPGNQLLASPGAFLAANFTLVSAANNVISDASFDPLSRVSNPDVSTFAQNFVNTAGNSVFQNARYATANTNSFAGLSPRRRDRRTTANPAGDGLTYSDGRGAGASDQNYITQGTTGTNGNTVGYEASTDSASRSIMGRNKIAFDFNGDGSRTLADAADMIAAWRQRNGGPAWIAPTGAAGAGQDAVIEILGDANGDGSFTSADVRYWADGLALVGGNLDRKAGFTAVDAAFGGNFFGTTLGNGSCIKAYANGDSRGDVVGPSGNVARGWAPVGADGKVDASDINYVFAQFKQAGISGNSADWSDLSEAALFDLSADMNGDLSVNQADVNEIVTVILGTCIGDVNLDGVKNVTDRAIATGNLGNNGGWAQGDMNGDGIINAADLSLICPQDFDCDASVTVNDIFGFLNAWFAGNCKTDFDADGSVTVNDIFSFLNAWFAGNC